MGTLTLTGSPTFNGDGSCTIDTTGADRVEAPSSLIDETQGWFAIRFRAGESMATMAGRAGTPVLFKWEDAGGTWLLGYIEGDQSVRMQRTVGGVGAGLVLPATGAWNVGDDVTIVFAWTATEIKASLNGGAFTTVGNTDIPTLAASTFDIGSYIATRELDSAVWWAAAGSGVLDDADAAMLGSFGNADPGWNSVPGAPTFVWTADDDTYQDTAPVRNVTGFDAPQFGFSTHLTDATYGTALEQAQKAVEAGATIIRDEVPWSWTETVQGVDDWGVLDAIGDACVATGLKAVIQVGYAPDWANGNAGNDKIGPDAAHIDDYGAFVRRVADRCHTNYPGVFVAIEYWNEPNIGFLTNPANNKVGDATYYTQLAQAAYEAVRGISPVDTDAAPEIELWGGATAGDGTYQDHDLTQAWDWLTEALGAGILNYCDAWSCHPYQFWTDATVADLTDITTGDFGHAFCRTFWASDQGANLADRLAAAGFTGLIHGTEWGAPTYAYPSGTHIANCTSEANQRDMFTPLWEAWRDEPRAGHLFFYTLKDPDSSDTSTDQKHFGAFRDDWSEKGVVAEMQFANPQPIDTTAMHDEMQRNPGTYTGTPVVAPSLLDRDADPDVRFAGGSSFTIPHSTDLTLLDGAVGGMAIEFPLLIPAYPVAEALLFNKSGEYAASILPDGTLRFYLTGGFVDSSAPIPLNEKVHVNLVYNGDYSGAPKFGKDTAGATTDALPPDYIGGAASAYNNLQTCRFEVLEKGDVYQLNADIVRFSDHPYSQWMTLEMYEDAAGAPGELVAQAQPLLIGDEHAVRGFQAFLLAQAATVYPGFYHLGFVGGYALTGSGEFPVILIGKDASGGSRYMKHAQVSDTDTFALTGQVPSPFGAPALTDDDLLAIYADYTPTGRTGDEGHMLIYLDGLEDNRSAYTGGITAGTADLTGPEFDVDMGELSLWNRKQTRVEVARHFAAR